jgi:hypothetical protein
MSTLRWSGLLGLAVLAPRFGVEQSRAPARVPQPVPRVFAALVADPVRGRVVLFGGVSDSGTFLNDTWELSAARWVRRPSAAAPAPRAYAAAAFDPTLRQVLLYGGGTFTDGGGDTWAWTGTGWRELGAESELGPRWAALMAADTARRRLVLVGGYDGVATRDTWEWDGATWIEIAPDGPSPPARGYGAVAYDMARRVVVVFGGDSADQRLGDTWEWDGRGWRERTSPAGPSARNLHAMAYDPQRRVVVLFGGSGGGRLLGDTWEWNGELWTEVQSRTGPTPRFGHAMAYDPMRRGVVLFGGQDSVGMTNDTWAWDGVRWAPVARASPRDTATERVLRALFSTRKDLTRIINAERAYFKEHGRYTPDVRALAPKYTRSFNVYLRFTGASDSGWAVEGTNGMASQLVCGVYVGKATPPIEKAKREGQIYCSP